MMAVAVFGFGHTQAVRNADHKNTVREHEQFCEVSLKRWLTQHDVIITVTEAIPYAKDGDKAAHARTERRNEQLSEQRAHLLTSLGPQPPVKC